MDLIAQWAHLVFVNTRVRAAFWGLVGTVLVVQLPAVPEATMPQWAKLLSTLATGTLIPWFTEFARKQSLGDPASAGERK